MEFTFKDGEIIFPNKELTILDKLVLKFTGAIGFDYVIVSGYIAILFGRDRSTEDIDIFIEKIPLEKFLDFCGRLNKLNFYILNAENSKDAYDILKNGLSVRFAENGTIDPNFEIKFPKVYTDFYSLKNTLTVILDQGKLITSEFELQIAYKIYLGSEKDEDDARHLYGIFKDYIDMEKLKEFAKYLKLSPKKVNSVLGDNIV